MHEHASSIEQVFAPLADRHSINIIKMAYFGFKGSSDSYKGNISKKQFYVRLKRLLDMGFIEKRNSVYTAIALSTDAADVCVFANSSH